MPTCTTCSAPLPAKSSVCEYCGNRNDVDLQGIHQYTVVQPETPRACPRCQEDMQTLDLGLEEKFLIERCEKCLGLFFDNGELSALLDGTVKNVFQIDYQRLNKISQELATVDRNVSYAKCPVCEQLMNRVSYGKKSGVVVDRCVNHGIWLDGGELRILLEWRKAGGQLFHEKVMADKRKDQEKKKKKLQGQKIMQQGDGLGASGNRSTSSFSEMDDSGMLQPLFSLLDRLFRAS